ncbi:MAG: glycosyltransferase [Ignavibacteriae bacterium]|nr:glycosyltransferase [Ignavibacteriota bacterium]
MTILHIAPTPFFSDRGCHIRILGELRALQENGLNVVLTTYHLGKDAENVNIYRTIRIPWYNKISVGGSIHNLYMDFFLLIESVKAVLKHKPSVIHGHLHEGALIAKFVSWLTSFGKTPVVFDVQGSLTGELITHGVLRNSGFLNKLFLFLEKIICHLPNYVVCSSKSNYEFIINEMKVPANRVSELIDGIYSNYFKDQNNDKLRKSLKIKNEKILIYSNSLLPSKGIKEFINAIPKILHNYNNVKVIIVGYPVANVKHMAEKLNIINSIIFLGRVDFFYLLDYLSIADIAVDPKVDIAGEGSGKIINYMGAGLPIVCFDSQNNHNFLAENGVFARSGDSDDLADKILSLLNDYKTADRLGRLNKERANEFFSWNVKGKDLIHIYNKIIRFQKLFFYFSPIILPNLI